MSLNTFNNIQYFDKFNLKNIVGKKIKTLIPTNNEIEVIKQISINDWIPERLLRLNSIVKSNKIKISNTLCVLNSICYSLKYLKKKVDKNKNINFIINETKILRTRWYKINNPEKRLILLINYTISNTVKLYYDYSKIFTILHKEAKLLKNLKKDIYYEIKKNNYIIFTHDKYKILYQTNKFAKKITYNYVYIPIIFYLHFFIQANQKGSLSKIMNNKINSKIKLNPKLNSSYIKLLIKKFNLAEENKNFLKFYKIKKGLIRYGFHYE